MQKHGCEFVSVSERIDTSSAMGKAMLNLLGVFAQFERDVAGERTKDALRSKRSQGRVYSKVSPYGYRRDGDKLEVDPATKPVLDRILTLTREGTGPTAIARTLNAEGVPSPGGSTWYAASVASVLNTATRFA
jgi:site-specific DNA recombinase